MEQKLIDIKDKCDRITELNNEMLNCMKEVLKVLQKGTSPYPKVNQRRAFKVIGLATSAKVIRIQMDMVRAQPTFPSGGKVLSKRYELTTP